MLCEVEAGGGSHAMRGRGGGEGVMLCEVEVKPEHMSLESFAEDGE